MLLDRSPLGIASPFDLHTLGTPLAFVLSQDQTLHENSLAPLHQERYLELLPLTGASTEVKTLRERRGYHSKAHLTSRHFPTV